MVSKGLTPASDQPLTPALPTQPRSSLGSYHRCPLITLDKYPSIHTESRIDELRRSHLECFGSNPLIATDFGSNPLLDRAPGPAGDAQVAGAVHGSTSSVPCWRGPGAQTKPAGVTNAQTQTRPNQTKTKTKPNQTQPKPKPKPKPKPNPNQTQPNPQVWISFCIGGEPAPECVVLELWVDRLPRTAENFRQLVRGDQGVHPLTRTPMHYKGSPIHRIVPGLCIQGGDFVCRDGSGGESIYGGYFADEGFVTTHTEPGLLCMVNAGPDTNRSQFYITTGAAPHLDGHHVIFGKVLSGMTTVEAIAALPVDDRERPARGREVIIHDCGEVITCEENDAAPRRHERM